MGKLTIVVAYSLNRAIGKDNKLLWKQSKDLKRFKQITKNSTVVMGRKTYESIGKPLPNRRNIVLSKTLIDDRVEIMSIEEVRNIKEDIFIIGGGEIYKEFLDITHEILATLIHTNIDGDTYFPEISNRWMLRSGEFNSKDDKNEYGYSFLNYVNRSI
jgi:dihydrofolate reductase